MNSEQNQIKIGPYEKIGVIIPAYRVASYIEDVLRSIPSWVEMIVVVNDASPDDTAQRVRKVKDRRLRLIENTKNLGVGGATLAGAQYAIQEGCTILAKMDGDGQMEAKYLDKLIWPIICGEADFTKGNRFADPSTIGRMPLLRRIGNLALSFMAKLATGCWRVFDPTNGYFALDSSVFNNLNQQMIHRRYFFEISLLFSLNLKRAAIMDIPIPAQYRGEKSSLSIGRTLIEFPWLMIRKAILRIWLQYFVLDFSVGSLFLLSGILLGFFGFAWGITAWINSIRTGVPATTGTVMLAVLPCILGFQLLIQAIVMDVMQTPSAPISDKWRERKQRREGRTMDGGNDLMKMEEKGSV